jgi:hydroxymethylglutaryl-CoA reductase
MNQLALVARPGHSTLPPAARPVSLSARAKTVSHRAPPALPPAASVLQRANGVYPCPFGFALTVPLQGKHRLVPIAAESAATLEPLAGALALVRRSGGFEVKGTRLPTAEIRMLFERVPDVAGATQRIQAAAADLLATGLEGPAARAPDRVQVAFELRSATADALAVHLSVDGTSSAHEGLLEHVAARLRPALGGLIEVSERSELHYVLRRRLATRCRVDVSKLIARLPRCAKGNPEHALEAIRQALSWLAAAEGDTELASAQNEVVLGNVASVAEVLGRDRQRIIVEGHAHAARFGRAEPLAAFTLEDEHIVGALELPLGLDWTERRHDRETDLANALLRGESVEAVGLLSACLGLAAHLATLEAVIPLALASLPRARSTPPPARSTLPPSARSTPPRSRSMPPPLRSTPPPPPRRARDDSGVHRTVHGRRTLPPPLPRRRECG